MTKKNEKYIKLQYKIMIFFLIGVVVPMLLINLLTSYIYEKNLKNSTSEISQVLSAQIESNIDTYLNNINQISLYPYYDDWIQKQMRSISIDGKKGYSADLEGNEKISDFLFNMMIQNKYIRSIFLTDLKGNVVYAKSNGGAMQPEVNFFQPYIETMNTDARLIETHKQSYLKRSNLQVFSYVRVIKDVNNNTPIGYSVIEIKVDAINKLINNMKNNKEDYIAIYLSDGSLLETNITDEEEKKEICGQYKMLKQNNQKVPTTIEMNNKQYMVSYSGESEYGLSTVIYRDEKNVLSNIIKISKMTQILTLSILLIVLINTYFLARKLTNPLNVLSKAMKKVQNGDFGVHVKKKNDDEVGKLTDCFNTMITKIDELVTKEYKMKIKENESEIKALQNQINPHFLYNTLESIAMMAEINDDSEVANMVSDLGAFFRFVVSGTSNSVYMKDELEYVNTYVRIQNVRFSNRINLKISIQNECINIEIIKLCIQPLVENSVLHGYKQTDKIEIEINIEKEAGNIVVGVNDKGVGMRRGELTKLKELIEKEDIKGERIGLRNVHQRLKLKYGETAGLHFESDVNQGMNVWFKIPDMQEE